MSRNAGLSRFSEDRTILLVLLGLLLAAYVVEINHGLPNRDIVWAYDSNPLIPLIAAKKIFLDGWNTGWHSAYPNFHYYVLLVFLVPYMGVQWLLGNLAGLQMDGGYPYGLHDFDTIFMHLAIITRFVSAAMAVGTVYWVYRLGAAVFSHEAGIFAAVILGFSPAIIYYVHTETLDVPMLFWASAALYCYVRALQTLELRFYIWLSVLAAISTATKDYSYGLFVLLPLPLVVRLAKSVHGRASVRTVSKAVVDYRHIMALGAFLFTFIIAENWIWNFSGFVNHVKLAGGFVPGAEILTTLGRFDAFSWQRITHMLSSMTFVLGWIGFPICIIGIAYAAFTKTTLAAMLFWPLASYYLFTVCQVLPAASDVERPFMAMALILAIFGGAFLASILKSKPGLAKITCAAAVIFTALNGLAMDLALVSDPRYQAEKWLRDNVPAGASLELYGNRSELPRIESQWKAIVLNDNDPPHSDVNLTAAIVQEALFAERSADFLIVSELYLDNYLRRDGTPKGTTHVGHFFKTLWDGGHGYSQIAHFVPTIARALQFPERIPAIRIFTR